MYDQTSVFLLKATRPHAAYKVVELFFNRV